MPRIGAIECQVVRILDADGILLTTATAGPFDDEGMIMLDEVDDHGILIDYYFGSGERLVVVECDGRTVEGLLDTRWRSANRLWWIGVSPPQAARTLAPVIAREQEPGHAEALPSEDVRRGTRVPAPLAR